MSAAVQARRAEWQSDISWWFSHQFRRLDGRSASLCVEDAVKCRDLLRYLQHCSPCACVITVCYWWLLRRSPPPWEGCQVLRSSCGCVGLSIGSHTSKTSVQTLQNCLYMLPVAVVRSFFDENATRYALPVSWMTSCFLIIGKIQTLAWSVQRSELFSVPRQVPWRR